jgi:very-short-patch-repair endonuclease
MRYNINKKHSTKTERIMYEILKELHIPFRHRWIIDGREIDFIVGNIAIEIDGHDQDGYKNNMLVSKGYIPLHLSNKELLENKLQIKNQLKNYVNNIF